MPSVGALKGMFNMENAAVARLNPGPPAPRPVLLIKPVQNIPRRDRPRLGFKPQDLIDHRRPIAGTGNQIGFPMADARQVLGFFQLRAHPRHFLFGLFPA